MRMKYIPDILYIDRRFLDISQVSSSLSKGRFPIQSHFPFSISSGRIEDYSLISIVRAFFLTKGQIGRRFQTASKAAWHLVGWGCLFPVFIKYLARLQYRFTSNMLFQCANQRGVAFLVILVFGLA